MALGCVSLVWSLLARLRSRVCEGSDFSGVVNESSCMRPGGTSLVTGIVVFVPTLFCWLLLVSGGTGCWGAQG